MAAMPSMNRGPATATSLQQHDKVVVLQGVTAEGSEHAAV